jgi:hypothetical protein
MLDGLAMADDRPKLKLSTPTVVASKRNSKRPDKRKKPLWRRALDLWPLWLVLFICLTPLLIDAFMNAIGHDDPRCGGAAPEHPPEGFHLKKECAAYPQCECSKAGVCGWKWLCEDNGASM